MRRGANKLYYYFFCRFLLTWFVFFAILRREVIKKGVEMPIEDFYKTVFIRKCKGCDKRCELGVKYTEYFVYDSEYAFFPVINDKVVRNYTYENGKNVEVYCDCPEAAKRLLDTKMKFLCENYKRKR